MNDETGKYDSKIHLKQMGNLTITNLFSMKGKVVVVTGGSRGIGLMMSKAYVENGAKVYIVSRKKSACDMVADALNSMETASGFAVSCPADIGSDVACKKLASDISKLESQIDVLVNNAGITWGSNFYEFPEAAWNKLYNVNVTSIFQLSRQCLRASSMHQ